MTLTIDPLLLDDLNNDFRLETIAVGSDYNTNTAYVFAWQPDGTQAPGFPIQVQDQNNLKSWRNHVRILAGDFDGDGAKEVLVQEGLTTDTYVLRLFNHDGTPKPFNAPVLTGIPFAMAAADLGPAMANSRPSFLHLTNPGPCSTFSSPMGRSARAGRLM